MTIMGHVNETPINYTTSCKSLPLFIREKGEEKVRTKHDQLFKELIHHFFEEFLEVFFPDVHEHIDFQSIKPMSEEMFTDLLDGESRRADIIIERSEEHTSELQSRGHLVCRLLLEKKNKN